MSDGPRCVVVGDVMTDVVVRATGPSAHGSDTPAAIAVSPGGAATNQAVWLARAGAEVHLVAAVGDDELGRAAERALERAGVHAHLAKVAGYPTGTVVALVDETGQRSMLTDRGANLALSPELLPTAVFAAGGHLQLSGYDLLDEATRAAGLAALELAASFAMSRSVDASSVAPLARVGAASFLSWTAGVELWSGNLEEGRLLTGADAAEEVARGLHHHYPNVALTLGSAGALYCGADEAPMHIPAVPTEVVDTTGAGDAFTGTFLGNWLAGKDAADAVTAGLCAAAEVVARVGARLWE
jgi:sugar/nucleoside kinase (ribokinase family)